MGSGEEGGGGRRRGSGRKSKLFEKKKIQKQQQQTQPYLVVEFVKFLVGKLKADVFFFLKKKKEFWNVQT